MRRRALAAVMTTALILTVPALAFAQIGYFGQNKVQYRAFAFRVMKTGHFDIY